MAAEITATSRDGRALLALRAGPMTAAELYDRVPAFSPSSLLRHGLIERLPEDCYRITAAGRAACPLRNPQAATVAPAPVAAVGTRHVKPDVLETKEVSVKTRNPAQGKDQGPSDQVRALLERHPEGIARKEIIRRTSLSESRVDNAIANLIRVGEARRTGYGHIAPCDGGKRVEAAMAAPAAGLPPPDADAVADHFAGVGKMVETATGPAAQPANPVVSDSLTTASTSGDAVPLEIEFALYDGGRLAIIGGDELMILPPKDTRRLGYFLGCLEILARPPRLAPEALDTEATHL